MDCLFVAILINLMIWDTILIAILGRELLRVGLERKSTTTDRQMAPSPAKGYDSRGRRVLQCVA
jgi:hypothetical protein